MNYAPGTIYNSIATSGYAVIMESDQYYVSFVHFRRLKDALAFSRGEVSEIKGKTIYNLPKPTFTIRYQIHQMLKITSRSLT